MDILKFGGTSLANAERIKTVSAIIDKHPDCIVVCSAMSGVTNNLEETAALWKKGSTLDAKQKLASISFRFEQETIKLLQGNSNLTDETFQVVKKYFSLGYEIIEKKYDSNSHKLLLSLGEMITSAMLRNYRMRQKQKTTLLNAPAFIKLNEIDEPVLHDIEQRLKSLKEFDGKGVYITQGFICSSHEGYVTNLKRGGSDYTATLIGAAINANRVEIWTDIDGLHNNDPRYISDTSPVRELSYAEASELAYFGAKILHPSCVRPARERNIPVYLKNTLNPAACGTVIRKNKSSNRIKAIAAKDNITVIRITSGRMFNAYGFLRKLFEIYDQLKIPVDVVTTSEVSVSMTIDDDSRLPELEQALLQLGRIEVEKNQSIICAVGDVPHHFSNILNLVNNYDIKMISMGGSSHNVTLVLPLEQKIDALRSLHQLFTKKSSPKKQPCLNISH
ncbi:MAG: aspartate kinase [Bacteroidales bacterium]